MHFTKIRFDEEMATAYYMQTDGMSIKQNLLDDELRWKQLAMKVILHHEINEIINESIDEFNVPVSSSSDDDPIKVTLVENLDSTVRGFSGYNEAYLNTSHFREKFDNFRGDHELLELLAKIDVISVTVHELAHIKIRKRVKNFNMSTPVLAKQQGLDVNHYEFGRYNEIRLFNAQVDWFFSAKHNINVSHIERFVNAIEEGTKLPIGPVDGALERPKSIGFGIDIQFPFYLE